MKFCVALDNDEHFVLINLSNRLDVIRLLKEIYYGCCWDDNIVDYLNELGALTEEDLLHISEVKWEFFVNKFIHLGIMEIKEV